MLISCPFGCKSGVCWRCLEVDSATNTHTRLTSLTEAQGVEGQDRLTLCTIRGRDRGSPTALLLDGVSSLCAAVWWWEWWCGCCRESRWGRRTWNWLLSSGHSVHLYGLRIDLDVVRMLALLQMPAEPDGSRFSLPARSPEEESPQQRSNQSQLTTPEK